MENQNPGDDKMLAMFKVATDSAQATTSAFGSKSSTTNVLRINMNSKDNQGTIIFIPIADLMKCPFICSVVHEVVAVWKGQDGTANNRTRQLLDKAWYHDLTPEQEAKWNELNTLFSSIYSNREMLSATDWGSYVSNQKYFGFYGWVIHHTDINGVIRKDKDGTPHIGKNGEGRLAYIQFKSTGFVNAWDSFLKQKDAMRMSPAMWVPKLFGRTEFRETALAINYNQDQNNKFTGSITEQWFSTQLINFINDPSASQQAYHLSEDRLADAKDLAKELINTDIEGNLFEDQHVIQFEKACRAVANSFDYYKAHGQAAYEAYSNNFGFNELDQNSVGVPTTPPPATAAIDAAVQAAQAGNPLLGTSNSPQYAAPGQLPPNMVVPSTPAQQAPTYGAPSVAPVTPPPAFSAPQWGAGAPMPGQQI